VRYKLIAVPEFAARDEGSRYITTLPKGTGELYIEAYWTVTEEDGTFHGGTKCIRFTLEEEK
jgi:hypothetical protein